MRGFAARGSALACRVVLRSSGPVPASVRVWGLPTTRTFGATVRSKSSIYTTARRCFGSERSLSASEAPHFAFAFDIDGVLLHVSKPIPGATESLRFLHDNHIPFILLTNGGGKHESERVADLSTKLGVPLTVDNFVQSHTPFRQLVATDTLSSLSQGSESLADKTVLVTGADANKCRRIAESYGFRNVVTPADILVAHPGVWPFEPLLGSVYAAQARPLAKPIFVPPSDASTATPDPEALAKCLKIDAIFVFNDPRDWALDTQLITDLLLSHRGYLGTYSPLNGHGPGDGWQNDGQPELFFSNADLFWSTGFHQPRFGQGAFQAAVAGVWKRVTGGQELRRRVLGKPYGETYRFAERVLGEHRGSVVKRMVGGGNGEEHDEAGVPPLRSVYMVGDNPESDIAGANDYKSEVGTEWTSVLVRTGVWSADRGGGEKALQGRFKPKVVVDDVREAVRWALEKEGWNGVF